MTLRELQNVPFVNSMTIRIVEYDGIDVFYKTIYVGTYDELLNHILLGSGFIKPYVDMPIEQIDMDGDDRLLIIMDNGKMFT